MNTVETLKAARALIADEKNWTQGRFARNERGMDVPFERKDAVCFCSVGALLRVSPLDGFLKPFNFLKKSAEELGGDNPTWYNDRHSHVEVLAMFDRAIASAEASV